MYKRRPQLRPLKTLDQYVTKTIRI